MNSITTTDDNVVELPGRPIQLPKFTLLLGGLNTAELGRELARINPDSVFYNIHLDVVELLTSQLLGKEAVMGEEPLGSGTSADFMRDLSRFLDGRLNSGWGARTFIENYDGENLEGQDADYILDNATMGDAQEMISRFSEDNVALLLTGPMIAATAPTCRNTCWLPKLDTKERILLLRREFGELK